jgi:FkbM family methyltransferase
MRDSLGHLRELGVDVQAVIDVGVQEDTYELRVGFPDVPHFLFEPIAEYHDAIRANYTSMDYELIASAVAREPGEIFLQDLRKDAAGVVSHVVKAAVEGPATRRIPAVSLDSFTEKHSVPKPYLLKIDVDGLESEILRGAERTLKDCSCLIVETTLQVLTERCWYASLSGLRLWDIVDFNYYQGNLYQVDLIFVHESQVKRLPQLDPYEQINFGLDRSAWFFHSE